MGETTGISWTDSTFNPWWGCTKVSPGCDHCYAESLDKRWGDPHWGNGVPRRVFSEKHWNEPLKWNREAQARDVKSKVLCASMADVMDDEAPKGQRERLWELIDQTPYLIWQLLTKRPQRYSRYLPETFKNWNVWLGTSAENQENYDLRWPILAKERRRYAGLVPVFISYEPALGPLTISKHAHLLDIGVPDWIICGGESGPGARPMLSNWADSVRRQCEDANIAFFFKQNGEWVDPGHEEFGKLPTAPLKFLRSDGTEWGDDLPQNEDADVNTMKRVGRTRAGDTLYGKTYHAFPR